MTKELILVGGGHSHLITLKTFAKTPVTGVNLTLVSPSAKALYSGSLAAYISDEIKEQQLYIDLSGLAQRSQARFIQANLKGVHPQSKRLILDDDSELNYDLLSLNTGSISADRSIPGAEEFASGVKPILHFITLWKSILSSVEQGLKLPLRIAFIGAGAAGCELALTFSNRLKRTLKCQGRNPNHIEIHLFSNHPTPCASFPNTFQTMMRQSLTQAGVHFHASEPVETIQQNTLLSDKSQYYFDYIFLSTPAQAPSWPRLASLATVSSGFIEVTRTLQSTSHPEIFATGDIATIQNSPKPKSGVAAVRQGKILAKNLRNFVEGKPLENYQAQKSTLALLNTGKKHALGTKGSWSAQGKLWWHLKNHLDHSFLRSVNSD